MAKINPTYSNITSRWNIHEFWLPRQLARGASVASQSLRRWKQMTVSQCGWEARIIQYKFQGLHFSCFFTWFVEIITKCKGWQFLPLDGDKLKVLSRKYQTEPNRRTHWLTATGRTTVQGNLHDRVWCILNHFWFFAQVNVCWNQFISCIAVMI
jgi:hypothetical protein